MKYKSIIVLVSAAVVFGGIGCSRTVTIEDWQQDLRTLERQLSERHVDLYHSVSESTFAAAVNDLHQRIPNLTPPEILVRVAQLVALVGDGHTSFFASNQKRWRFHYYPIHLYSFSDGIYLTATTEEYAHLFGKRLVKIDRTPIDEAFRAISTTIAADNNMEYQYTVPFELNRPEMLFELGIAESSDRAEFAFEDGTRQVFTPVTLKRWLDLDWLVVNSLYGPERRSPSMRLEFLFATPLTLPYYEERKYYWYTYLEDHRTLFLQYNVCWNKKGDDRFEEVVERLFAFMDQHPVERLIIDLRQNTGGEPMIAEPLIEGLERQSDLGARGGLFVLVGRRTFSAALTNAAHLRSRAGARIVGEPPRGKPNNPSEGRDIDLERTKIWLTVSTQFVERDPELGDADFLPVDIKRDLSFEEYRRAEDPVLDAALAAQVPPLPTLDDAL